MSYPKVAGETCPECGHDDTDVALPLMSVRKNLHGCPECGQLFEAYYR